MATTWTVGRKLIAAFMAVAVVTLVLGIVGYYGAVESSKAIEEIGSVRLPGVETTLTVRNGSENIRGTIRTLAIAGLPEEIRERQHRNLAAARETYAKAWERYEALPHGPEEQAIWKQFSDVWEVQRAENNKALDLIKKFSAFGIEDPTLLKQNLETFRGDHYKVEAQVLDMLRTRKPFDGGESHTDCAFGKWLASYQSDNPSVRQAMSACAEPHRHFHEGVRKAKALLAEGKMEEAQALFAGEVAPAAEKTFAQLREMRGVADESLAVFRQAQDQILGAVTDKQREAVAVLDKIVAANSDTAAQEVKSAQAQSRFLRVLSLAAMMAGVAAAMALGILISRGINKALRRIAASLGSGAEQTASAAGQVSAASQSLAQGTSEQAAAIEETSSSVEEMTSMTKQNAANAAEAKSLAAGAKTGADKGAEAMAKMSRAIDDIKKSSDQTAKIIKTIDEIAFQTNLLALNAAVEAARAGEAGKGFAVVAEEVRNLAQRSAEAARNTANMIEESVKNAENGVAISREVGAALTEIAEAARKVNDLVNEIAAASNEQAQGIEQINAAVGQMDQVTQSNAANAEESASASEELSAQAEELHQMVRELLAMVGGASAVPATERRSRKTETPPARAASAPKAPAKKAAVPRPVPKPRLADGNGKSAEELIPMEEEKALARF